MRLSHALHTVLPPLTWRGTGWTQGQRGLPLLVLMIIVWLAPWRDRRRLPWGVLWPWPALGQPMMGPCSTVRQRIIWQRPECSLTNRIQPPLLCNVRSLKGEKSLAYRTSTSSIVWPARLSWFKIWYLGLNIHLERRGYLQLARLLLAILMFNLSFAFKFSLSLSSCACHSLHQFQSDRIGQHWGHHWNYNRRRLPGRHGNPNHMVPPARPGHAPHFYHRQSICIFQWYAVIDHQPTDLWWRGKLHCHC